MRPTTAPIVVLAGAYLAFLPAEAMHVSAILAVGAAGRVIGARSPRVDSPSIRLTGYAFWYTWVYLLTAVLFVLIGLQLPVIIDALDHPSTRKVAGYAIAIICTVVLVRLITLLGLAVNPTTARKMRADGRRGPWAEATVAGWSGMRGAVSLVAAMALPESFPDRELVLLLAYSVIVVTLVGQGLTLPVLIRRLPIERDTTTADETQLARETAAQAAVERLAALSEEAERLGHDLEPLLQFYRERSSDGADPKAGPRVGSAASGDFPTGALLEAIRAERTALIALRRAGAIGDDVLRTHERELDMRASLSTPGADRATQPPR